MSVKAMKEGKKLRKLLVTGLVLLIALMGAVPALAGPTDPSECAERGKVAVFQRYNSDGEVKFKCKKADKVDGESASEVSQ